MKFIGMAMLFLVACNTYSGKSIRTPNGKPGAVIKCSTMSQCFEYPGSACPNGYVVLAHENNNGHETMVIECKESE